jgi:glutamine cyclotransferase
LWQRRIIRVASFFLVAGWQLAGIPLTGNVHAQSVTLWPAPPDTAAPPVFACRIIHTYPHDPYAFTQGLAFADAYFFEGTGLNGRSSLRKVIPDTGRIVQSKQLPQQYFGEGVTVSGKRLIQLTWKSHRGFVYDKQTFKQINTFHWPHEGWGISENGAYLIISDGSDRLFFLNPITFDTHHVISVRDGDRPVRRLNELEFVEGFVLANIWQHHRIAVIAPKTGRVAAWIRLDQLAKEQPRGVPNGIAYDRLSGRLFVTGKFWSRLYEVALILDQ